MIQTAFQFAGLGAEKYKSSIHVLYKSGDLQDELGPDSSADGPSFIHIHIIVLSFPFISSSLAHFQAVTVQKL